MFFTKSCPGPVEPADSLASPDRTMLGLRHSAGPVLEPVDARLCMWRNVLSALSRAGFHTWVGERTRIRRDCVRGELPGPVTEEE